MQRTTINLYLLMCYGFPFALLDISGVKYLHYFDNAIDKCEDFYGFVCGNFGKVFPSNETGVITADHVALNQVLNQIKEIVESEQQTDDDMSLAKIKQAYRACLRSDQVGAISNVPLAQEIFNKYGFPIIGQATGLITKSFNWNTIADLEYNYAILLLFTLEVVEIPVDIKDNEVETKTVFSLDYVLSDVNLCSPNQKSVSGMSNQKRCIELVKKIANAVRIKVNEAQVKQKIADIRQFQNTINNLNLNKVVHTRKTRTNKNKLFTLKELQVFTDIQMREKSMNWIQYLGRMLTDVNNVSIDESTLIHIENIELFGVFLYEISYAMRVQPQTLQNYIILLALCELAPYTSNADLTHAFSDWKITYSNDMDVSKSKCLTSILDLPFTHDEIAGMSLLIPFLLPTFEQQRIIAETVEKAIRKSAQKLVGFQMANIGYDTACYAKAKIANLKFNTIWNRLRDPIDTLIRSLQFSDNNHFENMRLYRMAKRKFILTSITKSAVGMPSTSSILSGVNKYVGETNKMYWSGPIHLLMWSLEPNMIWKHFSVYGKNIAEYIANAILVKSEILMGNNLKKFAAWNKKQLKCIDRFHKDLNEHIYGPNLSSAFLIETFSLKVALYAMEQYLLALQMSTAEIEKAKKHFFLTYAASFCANDDKTSPYMVLTGRRINTAIANTNDFSTLFTCERGSTMNPKQKCQFL